MPALRPIPPEQLKDILVHCGYHVVNDDPFNWLLDRDDPSSRPISIPKVGPLVAVEIMDRVLHQAGINNATYMQALEAATH